MSEKENIGVAKELTAEQKAKKKKAKYTLAKVIVAICVVLCIVLTVFELGFTYRTLKAAEVDGTEYSVAEYNWLYTTNVYQVYNTYYQSYGDLAAYFFNPNASLSEQQYSDDKTWADQIKENTDNSLIEMTKLYNAGVEAGYELSEEDKAAIDVEWEALEATAKQNGYSASEYAELSYGRGVNEKVFRSMYERYLYSFGYAEYYMTSQEVTSADIDAHYEENKVDFDNVTYKYFLVSGTAGEGEDEDAKMAEAKEKAEAMLSGEDETELNEVRNATKANINELFADWLFDSARAAGDKEVFEGTTGYYVVEFVSVNDLHYNTVDVRHILVAPEKSGDEESLKAALEKAESYKAEWEKNPTEENFAELAKKYSSDGSASVGGLYENVYKGQMVTEFEDWCFDSARKPGDCDIVETSYGYHVMFFSGEAEEYYTYAIDNAVRAERYTTHLDELTDGVEVTPLMGDRFVAKHFN